MEDIERDAARYRRLREIGAAPFGTRNLNEGTVLRLGGLDVVVDQDMRSAATSDQKRAGGRA